MGSGSTIVSLVGARPQFVKVAVIANALGKLGVNHIIVHTGQHYDSAMSAVFFDELGLSSPRVNLNVGSGSHGIQTAAMLAGIEEVLCGIEHAVVVVYGDTNTTLAGILAASKLGLRTAHVEAGLRSWNRRMPEEINRVVADHLSDVLLAPTSIAVRNLRQEGIPEHRIVHVGDVMFDACLIYGERAVSQSTVLDQVGLRGRPYCLATVHRAATTDNEQSLRAVFSALVEVAATMPVVCPLHPRTRAKLGMEVNHYSSGGLQLIEPVGYMDMLALERNAKVIATDSGGVQKESFFFRVPCVSLRTETEWVELVEMGWVRLAPPTKAGSIANAILEHANTVGKPGSPYGEGNAGRLIADALARLAIVDCDSAEGV